jgi:hypothetical protein
MADSPSSRPRGAGAAPDVPSPGDLDGSTPLGRGDSASGTVDNGSAAMSPRSGEGDFQRTELETAADLAAAGLKAGDLHLTFSDLVFGPVIGKGAYGKVYRGSYRGAEVAIKEEQIRQRDMAKYLAGEIATLT